MSSENPIESEDDEIEKQRIEAMLEEAMNEAEKRATNKVVHKGFAEDSIVQQYVQYAYEIGGIDLITTIECENGNRDMYRQSDIIKNGKREESYGFCQIRRGAHKEIVDDKRFRNDWKRQLDRCNELLKNGTTFYGRTTRKINGVSCPKYVENRFIIN